MPRSPLFLNLSSVVGACREFELDEDGLPTMLTVRVPKLLKCQGVAYYPDNVILDYSGDSFSEVSLPTTGSGGEYICAPMDSPLWKILEVGVIFGISCQQFSKFKVVARDVMFHSSIKDLEFMIGREKMTTAISRAPRLGGASSIPILARFIPIRISIR